MKKIIFCLIFLISFANAIQCYNGKTYVDIPESKLSDIGYTKYNITHSNFDCKMAYKRYLKVKEIEPVNISYVTKDENNEIEEPSKIGFFYLCLLVIIVCVIWFIKKVIKDEPQDDWDLVVQKEPVKHKNKTYEELLTRQEWYNFRNKVIYDREYVCEFCKKKHNLQVHHKLYYKKPDKEKIEPWLYNMNEVLLLCDSCHKSAHKKNKIKVYYISYADYNNRKVEFYNKN